MNTHTPIQLESSPVLSWQAPTRATHDRSRRWYISAGIVVVAAAAYGIFTGSWSFAIVAVLAGGMYTLIHDHEAPLSTIELFDGGVRMDGRFVRWDELSGFWILTTREYTELRLLGKRVRMVIHTGDQDVAQLRMILGQRIPELTHMKESIIDILLRICKL